MLTLVSLTTACAGSSGVSCAGWRPILPDADFEVRWTRGEKEQVLSHDEFGERLGCW